MKAKDSNHDHRRPCCADRVGVLQGDKESLRHVEGAEGGKSRCRQHIGAPEGEQPGDELHDTGEYQQHRYGGDDRRMRKRTADHRASDPGAGGEAPKAEGGWIRNGGAGAFFEVRDFLVTEMRHDRAGLGPAFVLLQGDDSCRRRGGCRVRRGHGGISIAVRRAARGPNARPRSPPALRFAPAHRLNVPSSRAFLTHTVAHHETECRVPRYCSSAMEIEYESRSSRLLCLRLGEGELFDLRRQHMEDVESHRDQRVIAEDTDKFD